MWQAKITNIDRGAQGVQCKIEFFNPIRDSVYINQFFSDLDSMKIFISTYLEKLQSMDGIVDQETTLLGVVDPSFLEITKVPEDADKQSFLTDLDTFKQYQKAITLGFVSADDQAFMELQKSLQTRFKITYLQFI